MQDIINFDSNKVLISGKISTVKNVVIEVRAIDKENKAKKKEADDKRAALIKERAEARQKLLDDQKAKRDALLNKKKENK